MMKFSLRNIQQRQGLHLTPGWYVFTVNDHGYADDFQPHISYAAAYAEAFVEKKHFGYVRDPSSGKIEFPPQ